MFVQRLLNKSIPGFVNRLAGLGSMVSCLMPPALTGSAPVNNDGGNGGQRSSTGSAAPAPFSGSGNKLGIALLKRTYLEFFRLLVSYSFLLSLIAGYSLPICFKVALLAQISVMQRLMDLM